mgnify:CR=1 FL=1
MKEALDIQVKGIVQGVGFRPFVYRLAKKYLIDGWVLNATDGVFIHAEGETKLLDEFVIELSENPPAASRVEEVTLKEVPLEDFDSFEIRFSDAAPWRRPRSCRPTWPPATIVPASCSTRTTAATATRSSTARTAARAHYHREAALRSQEHVDEGLPHVRALRPRVRRPVGPPLPRAARRVLRMRPPYQLART